MAWAIAFSSTEARFHGTEDAHGRLWQVATIQLDMTMPERFDLTCVNEQGRKSVLLWSMPLRVRLNDSCPFLLNISAVHSRSGSHRCKCACSPCLKTQRICTGSVGVSQAANIRADVDDANESLGRKYVTPRQKKSLTCSLSGIRKLKQKCLGRRSRPREIRTVCPSRIL